MCVSHQKHRRTDTQLLQMQSSGQIVLQRFKGHACIRKCGSRRICLPRLRARALAGSCIYCFIGAYIYLEPIADAFALAKYTSTYVCRHIHRFIHAHLPDRGPSPRWPVPPELSYLSCSSSIPQCPHGPVVGHSQLFHGSVVVTDFLLLCKVCRT